jgi:hypothetical protein
MVYNSWIVVLRQLMINFRDGLQDFGKNESKTDRTPVLLETRSSLSELSVEFGSIST